MFKKVSDEIYALGQQAVAAPGWRWVPEMLSIEPEPSAEDIEERRNDEDDHEGWRLKSLLPDGTMRWQWQCFLQNIRPEMCAALPDLSDERTLELAREVAQVPAGTDAAAVVAALTEARPAGEVSDAQVAQDEADKAKTEGGAA